MIHNLHYMVVGNVISLQYFYLHTSGGIPIVNPTMLVHHTIKYESTFIQMMLPTKVQIKNLVPVMLKSFCLIQLDFEFNENKN